MKLSFTEYIKQNGIDFFNIPALQKDFVAQKWAKYYNEPYDMTSILALKGTKEGIAFEIALSSIYFADNSDYKPSLAQIIMTLGGISEEDYSEELIRKIYEQYKDE